MACFLCLHGPHVNHFIDTPPALLYSTPISVYSEKKTWWNPPSAARTFYCEQRNTKMLTVDKHWLCFSKIKNCITGEGDEVPSEHLYDVLNSLHGRVYRRNRLSTLIPRNITLYSRDMYRKLIPSEQNLNVLSSEKARTVVWISGKIFKCKPEQTSEGFWVQIFHLNRLESNISAPHCTRHLNLLVFTQMQSFFIFHSLSEEHVV